MYLCSIQYNNNLNRKDNMNYVELNNGVKMPQLGYGVFQVEPAEAERCVLDAISVGYRLIDTAQFYKNEEGVGNAIAKCGVPRSELFIVTKVWPANAGEEKVRAIGVSNFYPDRLIDLHHNVDIKPAVNQVETHVFNQQLEEQKYMEKYNCQIMSWGPFAEGKNNFFNNETLIEIGNKHNKTAAQVALRYLLQRGVVVIPKSTHKDRMEQNMDIFNFLLTEEDMKTIEKLDTKHTLFASHRDPQFVELILSLK